MKSNLLQRNSDMAPRFIHVDSKIASRRGPGVVGCRKNFNSPYKMGFTIIELLVVVTVLTLLISLLLPSLEKARFLAQQTICGGRLHQLDVGLLEYVTDAKDYLPFEPSSIGYFWNEEPWMQRQDPAGGLPNAGPISLGRVYASYYVRDPKIWGCPATDYTLAPDHRAICWTPSFPGLVKDDGTGTAGVNHGWFYYGPITTSHYVAGTDDYVPYTRMGQRDPSWPALSDPYFRTDVYYPVDVVAHRQENINVVRNDGAVWRHLNPLKVNPLISWTDTVDYNPPGVHPWDQSHFKCQYTAAVGP